MTFTDRHGIVWDVDPETGALEEPIGSNLPEIIQTREDMDRFLDVERETRHELKAAELEAKELLENLQATQTRINRKLGYLQRMIAPSAARFAMAQTGGKLYATPHGTVGKRRSLAVEIEDEGAAIRWAREKCPEAVKVTEALLKTPLKPLLESGEEVPGARLEIRETVTIGGIKLDWNECNPDNELCEARR